MTEMPEEDRDEAEREVDPEECQPWDEGRHDSEWQEGEPTGG